MGEVWRARDTRLKRDVAAKILPLVLASDPDRVARFQREAQVLASLNHPGIASIYGFEDAGEVKALVMELVEGPTLAERIGIGPIPLDQSLAIARQIADALEAAHDQGVVHRDLKPANIKVRPDGTVKVLDFGLAKLTDGSTAASATATMSPTLSLNASMAGVILGTAAYMAPEQARGRVVDRRADIWAFGCVLYEMLTGRRAFDAEDVSLTLARVLERDVELDLLPADVPSRVRQTLRVCLRKDPKQRAGDIRDVRLALEGAFESAAQDAAVQAATVTPAPLWKRIVPVGAALVVGLALGAMARGLVSAPSSLPRVPTQFEMPLGEGVLTSSARQMLDVSGDGSRIVYVANRRLYVRAMSEVEARPLPGTDGSPVISSPTFSPDGQWIVFWSGSGASAMGSLRKISVSGGVLRTLCDATNPFGLTWSGNWIMYGQTQGILRVSADGGRPEQIVTLDAGEVGAYPHLLPDQETLLFTLVKLAESAAGLVQNPEVVAQSLTTGARKMLLQGGSDARYLSTGHLVYFSGGVVFAAPFDSDQLALTGGARPVVEGVRAADGRAHMSVSESGTLVYLPGPVRDSSRWRVARVDRQGGVDVLPIDAGAFGVVRVSPDGRQLALGTDDGKEATVWIYDLMATAAPRRLTFEGRNLFPVWSHDGQLVAFQSDREGDRAIFLQRADGAGVAQRLTRAEPGMEHIPESWAPDGSRLLYNAATDGTTTLQSLQIADKTSSAVGGIASPRSTLTGAALSPDGRWVAYASREGRASSAIFVEPFPPTGAKYQVSKNSDDGHHPVWTPDGMELVFTPGSGTRVSVVRIATRPSFSFGEEQVLFRPFRNSAPSTVRTYDVAPEGRHFIGVVNPSVADSRTGPESLRVVLDWTEELKRRVPVP
jgi:serine/threonine-protein kinase